MGEEIAPLPYCVVTRQGWGTAPCIKVLHPALVASMLPLMFWAQAAAPTTAARARSVLHRDSCASAPLRALASLHSQSLDGHEFLLTFDTFLTFVRGVAVLASANRGSVAVVAHKAIAALRPRMQVTRAARAH